MSLADARELAARIRARLEAGVALVGDAEATPDTHVILADDERERFARKADVRQLAPQFATILDRMGASPSANVYVAIVVAGDRACAFWLVVERPITAVAGGAA